MAITVDQLVVLGFKGAFQRDPEKVESFRQHRESLRKRRPELLQQFDRVWGSGNEQDAEVNRKYAFALNFLYSLPNGDFIGRASDDLGESGIVGTIGLSEIAFTKIYLEDMQMIDYRGSIDRSNGRINYSGTYQPRYANENYRGVWRMEQVAE